MLTSVVRLLIRLRSTRHPSKAALKKSPRLAHYGGLHLGAGQVCHTPARPGPPQTVPRRNTAFPYMFWRWWPLVRGLAQAEHLFTRVRGSCHGSSNASSSHADAPSSVARIHSLRGIAVAVRTRHACRFDLQVRRHERQDRVPGHTLRDACATDENQLGRIAADRSRCAAKSPIAPAAVVVETLPRPAPTRARASEGRADLLGMPGGGRRGVLPPHTLPRLGARRRRGAYTLRGSIQGLASRQTAERRSE